MTVAELKAQLIAFVEECDALDQNMLIVSVFENDAEVLDFDVRLNILEGAKTSVGWFQPWAGDPMNGIILDESKLEDVQPDEMPPQLAWIWTN